MAARNRIVLRGNLFGNAEQWSCGLTVTSPETEPVDDPTALSAWAEAIRTGFSSSTSLGLLRAGLSAVGSLQAVDAYYYPPSGPAAAVGVSTGAAVVGAGAATKPPQVGVVCTLLTALAGRSRRGRIYWPGLAIAIESTTGKMASSDRANMAVHFATLMGIVADSSPATGAQVGVYSEVLDLVTPVTAVRVGDVLDTQRRRRDGLVEGYSVETL